MIEKLDKNQFEFIRSGYYAKVDATKGTAEIDNK